MDYMGRLIEKMKDKIPADIPTSDELLVKVLGNQYIADFIDRNNIQMEVAKRYLSKLREYEIAMKNAETDGYVPTLIYVHGEIDIMYRKSKARIEQEQQRKDKSFISNGTMPIDIRNATFKDMHKTDKRKPLMDEVKAFIKKYVEHPTAHHKGLFVSGSYGIGKTYIMSAMANALAKKGFKVRIEHYPTLISELKAKIKSDTVADEVAKVKSANILILDDVGAEKLTEWIRDEVFIVILEYRMANHLPTFFTSNLTLKQFEEFLASTKEGVDMRKAQRIMERINFLAKELVLEGTNRRNPKGD